MEDNFEKVSKCIFELVRDKKVDKNMAFEILKELKQKKQSNEMDIAIIGMSCYLPGIRNIAEYWDVLEKGKQMITDFPEKRRADVDMFLTKEQRLIDNPYFTAGFLEEIDKFDNLIFKISPKEAENMDPYQRLFLQSAFETIEDAGYSGSKVNASKIGVFVGVDHTHKYKFSYINLINKPDFSAMTGSWTSILASRVSYTLNLNGPSMVIDSGCSSSLVAVHTACKSLKNSECSMALVGGINLIMFPLAESSMFNIMDTENKKVRPFDRDAKGTIWSEGVCSVLIKPLKDALVDRDHIYAVIKGSAVNNNGSMNAITSLDAQAHKKVIQQAWENARVNPETISYIEAHGTGTLLGDSIEICGLNNAFRDYTDKKNFCKIGSVKANIGHTVATSGMASLIKVVLAMKSNIIPASLNFDNPNPYINFNDSAVTIVCSNTDWNRGNFPRRAGVSSFSFCGTNCHMIIEESPDIINEKTKESSKPLIFTLSCKREAGIKEYLLKYKDLLEKDKSMDLVDICYTTSLGREHFSYRLAIISKNLDDLLRKIYLIINDDNLNKMDIDDVYFGKHAIVPSTKCTIDKDEITESERRQLSKEINEKIAAYSAEDSYKELTNCICNAYIKGAEINWDKLFEGLKPRRLSLPSYPLERIRYWVDTKEMELMINERELHNHNMENASDEAIVPIIVGESDGIYKLEKPCNDIVKKQLKEIEYNSNKEIKVRLTGKKEGKFTETEDRLAQIWGESLGLEEINIYDNFMELGGDSIVAMKVSSIISASTGVIVNMSDVMKYQTISELAEVIDNGILAKANDSEENSYTPISTVEEREYYPVSTAQKRIYILSQFEEAKLSYNVPTTIVIEGNVDKNLMEKAFLKILERHESLRTSFKLVDGQPVQLVNKIDGFYIEYIETDEENVSRLINEFIKPFDLSKSPLIRVALFKISEVKHILVFDMHHIICDGISIEILVKEMINGITEKKDLPKLKIQYKDFACWQNRLFSSELLKKQEEYWLNIFSDNIAPLNLPIDYQRPSIQSFEGSEIKANINKYLTVKLRELSKDMDATAYMTILAIYNILLSKYSGQEDITVGSVIAGRNHPDLQSIIGMFVNTLAIRNFLKNDITFKEFLENVKQNSLNAYKNQDYQFEELVNKLKLDRDAGRNPLFDVVFSYYGMTIPDINVGNLKISSYKFENRTSKFDLSLYAEERKDVISLTFEYCTKLFKKTTIDKMVLHFMKIAEQVLNNPDMLISDIQLISQEDIDLIHKFNKTHTFYPHEKTIHQLFEEQVRRTPNKVTVVFNDEKVTYSQLDFMANSLAAILIEEGVLKNDIVGINTEQSIEMIVAILAVLKSGCAYLPIDPIYPSERINYMLKECNVKIVLTKSDIKFNAYHKIKKIDLDNKELYVEQKSRKCLDIRANDLAYVIYTSGSTGVPKGVLVEHRSLVNLCCWHKEFYKITENDNSTKYAGFSFDASVWELFPYLISGATIHIINEKIKFSISQLNKYYEENDITISFLPTQVCEQFMEIENRSLRMLLTGGDKLNKFIKRNYTLVNNYGPTENTVVASSYIVENDDHRNIPIGKPISNNRIYIIDKSTNLQPIGLLGEICIAGDSLARGYINNHELNDNSFVDDIFVHGEKMYKTGDLARWTPDGNIEFWGRIDSQVKMRGYRIELSEIEKVMLKHEDINQAVVVVREDKNKDKTLNAYFTSKKKLNPLNLRALVAQQLPNYMIPNNFIELDELPLTPSGKINRRVLSEKNIIMNLHIEYVSPQNDIEKRLVQIWSELLGIEKIGVNDNFFDIGGHSLKAMSLANIIREEFCVEIPLTILFNFPRIAEVANYIKNAEKKVSCNKPENLVLLSKGTDSSKNLYMIHAGDGGVEAYLSISNESNSKYNYWGIKANEFKSCAPQNLTIEQIAAEYVSVIRQHQPEGPYHLLGWSVGGVIAFEIARQIESLEDVVELLCIIDSYAPERNRWKDIKEFDVESEKNLLINQIKSENIIEQIKALSNIEEIWNLFINHINEANYDVNKFKKNFPKSIRQSIPNFEELNVRDFMYYYNAIRTFHNAQALYTPKGKVNAKIQYLKANESEVENEKIWGEYCSVIEYSELLGNHYSIFSNQNIREIKKVLAKAFE